MTFIAEDNAARYETLNEKPKLFARLRCPYVLTAIFAAIVLSLAWGQSGIQTLTTEPPVLSALSGPWQYCEPGGHGVETCRWEERSPGGWPAKAQLPSEREVLLRKQLIVPARCYHELCSIVFSRSEAKSEFFLNGHLVGQSGPTTRLHGDRTKYALAMPLSIAALQNDDNELTIRSVNAEVDDVARLSGPIFITTEDAAFRYLNTQVAWKSILPLCAAAGVLTLALISLFFISGQGRHDSAYLPFLIFCAAAAAAGLYRSHLSCFVFSRTARYIDSWPLGLAWYALVFWALLGALATLLDIQGSRFMQALRWGLGAIVLGYLYPMATAEIADGITASRAIHFYEGMGRMLVVGLYGLAVPAAAAALQENRKRALIFLWPLSLAGIRCAAWHTALFDPRPWDLLLGFPTACFLIIVIARRAARKEEVEKAQARTYLELSLAASQTLHDLKSPLGALYALNQALELPEDQQTMLQAITHRVQGICDALSPQAHLAAQPGQGAEVMTVAQSVYNEQKLQRGSNKDIILSFEAAPQAQGVQAECVPMELARMVSNLVNNAVEAVGACGRVHVLVACDDDTVGVSIFDDGPGVSDTVVKKLGQVGNTRGKAGGQGLGLYHAVRQAKQWGGHFRLRRRQAGGTHAQVILKRVNKQ